MPGRLRSLGVESGFEGGEFVTFIPAPIDSEFVRDVINRINPEESQVPVLFLRVDIVVGGVQIVWKLDSSSITPVRAFVDEANNFGAELLRLADARLAA